MFFWVSPAPVPEGPQVSQISHANQPCRMRTGVMARSMNDIILYDELFSDCERPAKAEISSLEGLRLGYPTQLWEGLDNDVGAR